MVALQARISPEIAERFDALFGSVDEIVLSERAVGREPAGTSVAAIAASRRYMRALATCESHRDVEYRQAVAGLRTATIAAEQAVKSSKSAWASWYAASRVLQFAAYQSRNLLFLRESEGLLDGLERLTG